MNRLLSPLLFLMVACQSTMIQQPGDTEPIMSKHTLSVGGEDRTFWLYDPTPESVDPKPLVIAFHGSNHSGMGMSAGTGLNAQAMQGNFMIAYPDAPVGNWAEGCGCNNADRLQIPDLEFVDRIIHQVGGTSNMDPEAIYALGFSQGGLFAGRLACERSEVFAGVLVVAANMSVPLAGRCNPTKPVDIVFIQGMMDNVLPYYGSNNGALSLMAASDAAVFWAHKNGLPITPEITHIPPSPTEQVEVAVFRDPDHPEKKKVELHSLIYVGHVWPYGGPSDANSILLKMVRP